MEDDILPNPTMSMDEIEMPCEDADILWLSNECYGFSHFDERFCILDVDKHKDNRDTKMYFITPRGARQILESLEPIRLFGAADRVVLTSPKLRIFSIQPEYRDYIWKDTGRFMSLMTGIQWRGMARMCVNKSPLLARLEGCIRGKVCGK